MSKGKPNDRRRRTVSGDAKGAAADSRRRTSIYLDLDDHERLKIIAAKASIRVHDLLMEGVAHVLMSRRSTRKRIPDASSVTTSRSPSKETIDRKKLYEMVWDRPVELVASELGITGSGLGKVCIRANVPIPPRGYWMKHAAGTAEPRPPLPDRAEPEVRYLIKGKPFKSSVSGPAKSGAERARGATR